MVVLVLRQMLIIKASHKGMINEKKKCTGLKESGVNYRKGGGGGGKTEGRSSACHHAPLNPQHDISFLRYQTIGRMLLHTAHPFHV